MRPPTSGRKRQNLTLDLNSSKRNKVQSLLTSPDVQMLKLTSPELEKFLIQNPSLATPTPNGYTFPPSNGSTPLNPQHLGGGGPKSVTEEQKMYVKGFEEALEQMKAKDSSMNDEFVAAATTLACLSNAAVVNPSEAPPTLTTSTKTTKNVKVKPSAAAAAAATLPVTLASLDSTYRPNLPLPEQVKVKDEPSDPLLIGGAATDSNINAAASPNHHQPTDTSSSSSSMVIIAANNTPIDMDTQEMIKLERKRLRNRLAASKCRKSKLEKISRLDERVKQLKSENADLAAVVKKMKDNIALLKQEVIEHVNTGCSIRIADNML